jgi:hypothetical protein
MVSPLLGAPKERLDWLERCVEHMTNEQVAAIIGKHLRDNPARWHQALHIESWVPMKDPAD